MAASAATIISVAGTKRFITPSSYMLIHQLSTFMSGNFEQLKEVSQYRFVVGILFVNSKIKFNL
jgi:ATP-dependent protease ClpP protease subunit